MPSMSPPQTAPSPPRGRAAAPALPGARRLRLGAAFPLLAALLAAPSVAAAQGLPQGYTSDGPAGEAAPSPPAEAQPVQVDVGVSAELAADEYYEDTDPSALVEFEEPLAAYGTWLDDPSYGRVWVPSVVVVGPDFAPYQTAGHWSMTDDGEWLWVSDYTWGHIPFHYGRWVWISAHGWAWIPGRVYAPAWVVWRVGDHGYIGWAPMPPTYYWSGGVAVSLWTVPPAAYVFCPTVHVFHHHVHRHVVRDRAVVRRIAAHSHVYRPARPTAARPGRAEARPGGAAGARPGSPHALRPLGHRPASPSLAEARIPAGAAPKVRARPDARALAYARKSTTPSARMMHPAARGMAASPAPVPGGRRAAPSLRTPRVPDRDDRAPLARPAVPARGPSVALPRAGEGAPHRSHGTIAPPPARGEGLRRLPAPGARPSIPAPAARPSIPAPAARPSIPAPAARPSIPAPAARPSIPAPAARPSIPAPSQPSAPAARPRPSLSAPSAPPRPRIHMPSGPAPGRSAPAPAPARPRSR